MAQLILLDYWDRHSLTSACFPRMPRFKLRLGGESNG
jgi:hypothetical protein